MSLRIIFRGEAVGLVTRARDGGCFLILPHMTLTCSVAVVGCDIVECLFAVVVGMTLIGYTTTMDQACEAVTVLKSRCLFAVVLALLTLPSQ